MCKSKNKMLWLLIAAAVLLAVLLWGRGGEAPPSETVGEAPAATTLPAEATEASRAEWQPRVLKDAIRIDGIGSYTGIYVEDGSDEPVSGLLMMTVTNISDQPIQYARIQLEAAGERAEFSLSVLPAGASAVLIEQNRMAYDEHADYAAAPAECVNLAGFDKPLSLRGDMLEIQVRDGAINITNISGGDITGTIVLCYKNVSNGVFHGGIAYRVKLEEGLKDGETRQIMGGHFHQEGSRILFVDIVT